MAYTLEEFNPIESALLMDNREFVLSRITLELDRVIHEELGGIAEAFKLIEAEPMRLFDLCWILIKDKAFFDYNRETFQKYVIGRKENLQKLTVRIVEALHKTVKDSMPLIVNAKRYKEIQEVLTTTTDTKPCYVRYYDSIANRYGYTIEQFYELTLRQVHMLLQIIGDVSYEELEVQAALNGRELKPRIKYDHNISEEEVKEQEDDAMEALKELQRKYQENKDK